MESLEDIVEHGGRPGDAGRAVLRMEPYLVASGKLSKLEQLLNRLGAQKTSQLPVRVTIELHRAQGDLHILRGDVHTGCESFTKGLELISSLGRELEWKLRLRLATASHLQGNADALDQLNEVIQGARVVEDRAIYARALLWKSRYLLVRGFFEECYEVVCLACSTAKELGLPVVEAEACLVLASLERQLGQTAKGAEDCAEAEHAFYQVGDELQLSWVWLEQAKFELDYDNPDAARKLAMQARSFFMTQGMRQALGSTCRALGLANHLSGQLNNGLEDYQEAIRLLKDAGDLYLLATVQWDLGRLLQEAGNAKRAQAKYQEALSTLAGAGAKRTVALVEGSMATLLAEEGQIGESNMMFKRASSVLNHPADPQGGVLCKLFEAQMQLAQAWRVGSAKGPALQAKAMETYRGMREPSTKAERSNGRSIEVRLLLRMLRRRIKQASK
jgi:tetratricopeptide (TPR) repeat protein